MHKWSEDIWNTTHLGFVLGIDPQFLDEVNAKVRISNDIKNALPRAKVPRFELVFTTPSIVINEENVLTKAFAIETDRSTSKELMKILKVAYKDTKAFVPFQMKQKSPEAYQRTIKQNTKIMAGNHIIVLNNIGPDAMYYLKDHILAVKGVKDVAPAPSYEKDGKYRVQVLKIDFHRVRRILIKRLATLYETEVPPDGKATTSKYNGPPEVAAIASDGYSSSSDGSYTSASIATAMSYDPITLKEQYAKYQHGTDEDKSIFGQPTQKSWADTLKEKHQPPKHIDIENPSNEVADVKTETSKLASALAASQAEVETLKSRLAQVENERNDEKMDIQAQVKEQVAQALKEHSDTVATVPSITTSQFAEFVAMQDRRFQDMFTMFHQLLTQANQSDTISASKRPAIIDLSNTSAGDNTTMTSQLSDPTTESRKRPDRKTTPHKEENSNLKEDGQPLIINHVAEDQSCEAETPTVLSRIRPHQTTPTSMWYSPPFPPSPNLGDAIMQDDVANPPTESKEMAEEHYSGIIEEQEYQFRDHLKTLTPIQLEDVLNQHSQYGSTLQVQETNLIDSAKNKNSDISTDPDKEDKHRHNDQLTTVDHANRGEESC